MKSISFKDIAEKFNDGVRATSDNNGLYTELSSSVLEMPLKNSLVMVKGPNAGVYTRSGTASIIDRYGIVRYFAPDSPRFNERGLLFEGERTNLIPYSNDFTQWTAAGVSIATGYGISPDGTQNSTKIHFTNVDKYIQALNIQTIGNIFSSQIWVKGTEGQTILFSPGTANIIHTLSGKWELIKWENIESTRTDFVISTYSGATARDIEVFGAQCEEAPFCSSYIPTDGTAETRGRDDLKIVSENIVQFNTKKTVALDYTPLFTTHTERRELLNFSNHTVMRCETNGDYKIYNGSTSILLDANTASDRIVMTYDGITLKGFLNNEELNDVLAPVINEKIEYIHLGSDDAKSAWGYIQNLRIFDTVLNDTALIVI